MVYFFYGEENLLLSVVKSWKIHYLPSWFIIGSLKLRRTIPIMLLRLRKGLCVRTGVYFMFIQKKFKENGLFRWFRLKKKGVQGDFKALQAYSFSVVGFGLNIPRILKEK
jgi:hypothetical protein